MSAATPLPRRGLPSGGVSAPTDKRFRRPDVRPGRRRSLGRLAGRGAIVVLVVAIVIVAGSWVTGQLLASRMLAVSHIVVRGNTKLSRGEVEALVDGLRGENILRVDFDAYRKRLMDSPWVASATMARVLPSTVQVTIVERVPMAIARIGQQVYLVDDTGVIMDQYGPPYLDVDLPIVDGLMPALGESAAQSVDPERIRLTQAFLDHLRPRADLRARVSQIDVSDARDLVAILSDDPARVHLGTERFAERLDTYLQIAPTLRGQIPAIDYIDLRFDDRVFIGPPGKAKAVRKK